jgi:hypothetical protein
MVVDVMRGYTLKRGDQTTLGWSGRNNSKSSIGSSGHTGGTSPGQTHKTPKDLSVRNVDVGRVGFCMLCTGVIEEGGDGESV